MVAGRGPDRNGYFFFLLSFFLSFFLAIEYTSCPCFGNAADTFNCPSVVNQPRTEGTSSNALTPAGPRTSGPQCLYRVHSSGLQG